MKFFFNLKNALFNSHLVAVQSPNHYEVVLQEPGAGTIHIKKYIYRLALELLYCYHRQQLDSAS